MDMIAMTDILHLFSRPCLIATAEKRCMDADVPRLTCRAEDAKRAYPMPQSLISKETIQCVRTCIRRVRVKGTRSLPITWIPHPWRALF